MNPQISEMLPPSTIGIPTTSSPSDKSESENSYNDGNDDVVITLFNRFDQGSTDKSSTMKSIPEASIADDSFYQRIDDKEFKVESVNELDGSVYFKVQALTFQEDYSKEQLLGYIDQLSSTLKRAEKSVRKQKSRRQSREQTIVKMAKVLKGQNDTLEHLKTRIDELKSEIRMKEAENSLSDQRLRNTMKDLRNAETEIKSLSEGKHKQVAQNAYLQKKISSQGMERGHSTLTRIQQRRMLKGVAMILFCVSLLTAICALFGCKVTSTESIAGDLQCDMMSNLGACHHLYTSRGAEADAKRHPQVSKMKQRNFLSNTISKSMPSSIAENFFHRNTIH